MSHPILPPELAVANTILRKVADEGRSLTHNQLQKMMYFIYKKYLQDTQGTPLFDDQFEAWKLGPVLRSVYHEFKQYGSSPITGYAYKAFDKEKQIYIIGEKFRAFYNALEFVWMKYRHYDPSELSELTHKEGTAWYKAWHVDNNVYLEDQDILKEVWFQ